MNIKLPRIINVKLVTFITLLGVLLLGVIGAGTVGAQTATSPDVVGYYTRDGNRFSIVEGGNITITKLGDLSPSQLEAKFPISSETEASIVHTPPSSPVIIDGVVYKPEEISRFNGRRLRFVTGPDGNLYGFTTAEGLEQFQIKNQRTTTLSSTLSCFWMAWWYTEGSVALPPGSGVPYLSQMFFDNQISSAQIGDSASWAYLFDYENYGGDYLAMAGGTNYPVLALQGWNDRASSVYVAQ